MLLALDTSTRKIGIALYDGSQVLHESVWTSENYHTVELAPAIETALQQGGYDIKEIQALAVALGPGSYTGLRIGLAVAKGLAMSRGLPLIGVPTFDILAAAQPVQDLDLAIVLEAGRGRLGVGWYQAKEETWRAKGPAEVLKPAEFSKKIRKPTLICGELDESLRRLLGRKRKNVVLVSPALSLRRPAYLAEIGWQRWQAGEQDDIAALAPIYLHSGEPLPG